MKLKFIFLLLITINICNAQTEFVVDFFGDEKISEEKIKDSLLKTNKIKFLNTSTKKTSVFDYKQESFLNKKYHIVYNGNLKLQFYDLARTTNAQQSYYVLEPQNGTFGVVDNGGNVIVPLIYESLSVVNDSLLLFRLKNSDLESSCGIMNINQKIITKNKYTSLKIINTNPYHFIAELKTEKLNKKGIISLGENWIIDPEFENIQLFSNQYNQKYYVTSLIKESYITNKPTLVYGLYNTDGTAIVPTRYNCIDFETENLIKTYQGATENQYKWDSYSAKPIKIGTYGVFSTNGKMLIVNRFHEIKTYDNGKYIYGKSIDSVRTYDGKFENLKYTAAIYTSDGAPVMFGEYEFIQFIKSHDCFLFSQNGKYGYANSSGEIIKMNLDNISFDFQNKCIGIKQNTKWGVIDSLGTTIIPFLYDDFILQANNLIITSKNNKIGAINSSNKTILPFEFDLIKKFGYGFLVKKDTLFGYFSADGKQILPISYTEMDCTGFCTNISAKKEGVDYKYDFNGNQIK